MSIEREKSILELLLKYGRISVKELSEKLYFSESSIRRDIANLESQRLLKRTHGGIELYDSYAKDNRIPFMIRELEAQSAKQIMARRAAELVNDGDVIFLDGSSSVYYMLPFLAGKKNLTVITNGVKNLMKLGELNIRAISTGGEMISDGYVLVGDAATKMILSINANAAFFSARGISEDGYLTDISMPENIVREKMIEMAEHSYLLCSSDKFGKKYYHNLCHKDEIDRVIDEL